MKKLAAGLLGIVLSSCGPSYSTYYGYDQPNDAMQFTYYNGHRKFSAIVTKTGCDKPCQIVIDEYRNISETKEQNWVESARWVLDNYGNKQPYAVQRITSDKVMNLKEKDLDRQGLPFDTLRAHLLF